MVQNLWKIGEDGMGHPNDRRTKSIEDSCAWEAKYANEARRMAQ